MNTDMTIVPISRISDKAYKKTFQDFQNEHITGHKLEAYILSEAFDNDPQYKRDALIAAIKIRGDSIEQKYNVKIPNIRYHTTAEIYNGAPNIENQIGGIAVPLCNAGTFRIKGQYANDEYPIWLATHESGLVAGMKNVSKLVKMVDGVKTVVTGSNMTRAPIIETSSIEKAQYIANTINTDEHLLTFLSNIIEEESKVSRLLGVEAYQLGRDVHIRFEFDTGDCMGMNSATIYGSLATEGLKYYFETAKNLQNYFDDVRLLSLSGNMCTDKKQTHMNIIKGRGVSVQAEIIVPEKYLQEVYKSNVTAKDIATLNEKKNWRGSAFAGTISGYNANVSNPVAALFLATGQDAAQIVESSAGFTFTDVSDHELRLCLILPSLEVATTGGGTDIRTAREYLQILGCYGPGRHPGDNKKKLAEIIAGATAAQELNLLSVLAKEYTLAESHAHLGRCRDIKIKSRVNEIIESKGLDLLKRKNGREPYRIGDNGHGNNYTKEIMEKTNQ